jgi:hypothetical protein
MNLGGEGLRYSRYSRYSRYNRAGIAGIKVSRYQGIKVSKYEVSINFLYNNKRKTF